MTMQLNKLKTLGFDETVYFQVFDRVKMTFKYTYQELLK